MLFRSQAEVTAEAAKAEVQEAPKRATALQTEALKATTTSKDKQLGNLTKIAYAKIMSNGKFRAALAASGIKQNEVKLYPSTIPGQVTFATKGGNIYTYQEGKSGNGFSSPPSIKPVDMSAANIPQQVSSIDPNAMADSPADVFPED